MNTVDLFAKTWTKGHWPLDDLWPHICWGHMCDSTQGSLCPSPMGIHQCMWIQWWILQITTYIHTHTYYVHTTYILRTYYIQNQWSHSLSQARQKLTKNWFSMEITHKLCFLYFFCFRIHFHYVLSHLFGLFGVRTCVSILWHTSLPKNATFAWKNSKKPWFWRFLVIFVFLTWRHLWHHCGVIQGMFVLFLVPMDSGGS